MDNRIALADECIEAQLFEEAIELLEESLSGIHETNPGIMQRLAQAQFENDDAHAARTTLERLIEANPEYRSPEGHLLYARSLAQAGDTDTAIKEYEALYNGFPGEEARVRFGLLLQQTGEPEKARSLFHESLNRAKHAPKHYRSKEKDWLKIAEREC